MPSRIKSVCAWPSCPNLTREGMCEKHAKERIRPTAKARGYDTTWHKLRTQYKREHPVCEILKKCTGDPTEEVDHIKPLSQGGERLDEENLQSTCKRCHSWKTRHVDAAMPSADR